ncbi:LOW QUALITY PROTEIN: Myc proto-oncogene protein [Frankliniella fusca]|uniref:Myc proto-oncogene protein n=1 Tax=Frankliniella fusca TaxID=407009 RepID=A0AAE1HZ80_9NEOP|nr:LOW QUALITY PROTEIN: Myc proto-oncogene protein [Frankliniella fusca]
MKATIWDVAQHILNSAYLNMTNNTSLSSTCKIAILLYPSYKTLTYNGCLRRYHFYAFTILHGISNLEESFLNLCLPPVETQRIKSSKPYSTKTDDLRVLHSPQPLSGGLTHLTITLLGALHETVAASTAGPVQGSVQDTSPQQAQAVGEAGGAGGEADVHHLGVVSVVLHQGADGGLLAEPRIHLLRLLVQQDRLLALLQQGGLRRSVARPPQGPRQLPKLGTCMSVPTAGASPPPSLGKCHASYHVHDLSRTGDESLHDQGLVLLEGRGATRAAQDRAAVVHHDGLRRNNTLLRKERRDGGALRKSRDLGWRESIVSKYEN